MTACFNATIVIIWVYPKYWLIAHHIRCTVPFTQEFHIPSGHYTVQNHPIIIPEENINVVVDNV